MLGPSHQPALPQHDVELVDVGKPRRGGPQHEVGVTARADQRVCAQETVRGEVVAGGLELALVRLALGGRQAPPGRVHLQKRELDDIAVHGSHINIRGADRRSWRWRCSRRPRPRPRSGPRAAIVFWPGPKPLAKPPALERLAQAPGLDAFGFMSTIQGSYTPEQAFLDMSAGARTTNSLYDDEVPTDMQLGRTAASPPGTLIADRARGAPADVVPGLLASAVRAAGGHVGYAGPRAARNREAAVAADRAGRVERVALAAAGEGRRRGARPVAHDATWSSPSLRPARRASDSCARSSPRAAPATSCS